MRHWIVVLATLAVLPLAHAGEAVTLRTDTSRALVPVEEIVSGLSAPDLDVARDRQRHGRRPSGDAYESAADLRRYIGRFHLRERVGPPRLVRFVNLVFQAFGPGTERLQDEKLATLAGHRATRPDLDIFRDRSLEILSRMAIDVRAAAAAAVA